MHRLIPAIAVLVSGAAAHAEYPEKPIAFIVPFAAGSATDNLARVLGQEMTNDLKQRIIADDRPGASGIVGAQAAAKAAPDGQTVFITTNTTQSANPHLYK